jgi:hypothetical protein
VDWGIEPIKSPLAFDRIRVMFPAMRKFWLALLVIGSGCSHPDYQGAIQRVLDDRCTTRNQITHPPRNRIELMGVAGMNTNTLIFDAQDFALILQTISARGCPEDFRQAWSGYVSAWHYRANATGQPFYVLEAGVELSQSESAAAFYEGQPSNGDGESRTVAAWKTVQRISDRYGARAD